LEFVRREVRLGRGFAQSDFERALEAFRHTYNVAPERALCAPDVLSRFAEIFERSGEVAHLHSARLAFGGVPLVAGIVPPGTVAFEGHVDETKMGDW
jgi:hypothetical protein